MGVSLTVYVGPYLQVESTEEVDNYIAAAYPFLRDGMMEGSDDSDRSIWILDDCEGQFDRACEFERTSDNPAVTSINQNDVNRETARFEDIVSEVVTDIKRLHPEAGIKIRWGVVCGWS